MLTGVDERDGAVIGGDGGVKAEELTLLMKLWLLI